MKRLFKIITILIVLAARPNFSFSQNDQEKLELLRVTFISKKLELNNTESEKFWPIYNEYNDKIKAIKKNIRQSYRKKTLPLTELDAEDLFQLEIKSRQAEVDLFKQYSEKMRGIIGIKKIVRLRVAEEEFKREIINSIKDNRD